MTIEKLQNDPSYSLLLMLPHDDILPFVEKQFYSKTVIIRTFLALNVLLLAMAIGLAAFDIWHGRLTFWDILSYLSIGTLIVFTIMIPVHEGLHGLAYKLVGAPTISFGVNWKKFYFFAVADRFIVARKPFTFIALLPFATISLLGLATLAVGSLPVRWIAIGVLLMHTTACAGDFAMLSFYEQYRHARELLTYDDVSQKRSYFYVRE